MFDIAAHNRNAWNKEAAGGQNPWTAGVSHDIIALARAGDVRITLTPQKKRTRRVVR